MGRATMDSNSCDREALLLKLLALPGAVAPTVLDDVTWAWDANPRERGYIDKLQLIQANGVYPDREARLVRFNPGLLVVAFPVLREHFAAIQALPPMRFSGRLPNRPPARLRLVHSSP